MLLNCLVFIVGNLFKYIEEDELEYIIILYIKSLCLHTN